MRIQTKLIATGAFMLSVFAGTIAMGSGVPASTGRPFGTGVWSSFTTDNLFSIQYTPASGTGVAGWIVALENPTPRGGPPVGRTIYASGSGSGTAATCRTILRNENGSIASQGANVTVPTSGAAVSLGSVSYTGIQNALVYCTLTANGGKLAAINW
jgi:hypothetical protein